MTFDTLIKTQPILIKRFKNTIKKDKLSQIYLFEGAKGTKKLDAAYYLAALILCQCEDKDSRPCLNCPDCKKILEEHHSRIFKVSPLENTIKKEQIADLEREFSLISFERGPRCFIIEDIDKATPAAANSLLKFLEETNAGNYGILITENLQNVIATIRSRSQIISFTKIPKKALVEEYVAKGVDDETARILSVLTNDIKEGMDLISQEKVLDIFELVKNITKSLFEPRDSLLEFYEKGKFLLEEAKKNNHMMFIDLLITITNDRLYFLLGQKSEIVFKETLDSIPNIEEIDYKKTYSQVVKLLEYKQRMNYNINMELMYMDMLTEMRK